jgi:methionyl-tRNA formyltransferase
MDNGPLFAAGTMPIASEDNYLTLEEKLANLGAELLVKIIPEFLTGNITPKQQDGSQATFTKKFKTEDGFIESGYLENAERDDTERAKMILNKINAFNPEPGAWTIKNGKRIKLLGAKIQDGRLVVLEQQTEGEKSKKI